MGGPHFTRRCSGPLIESKGMMAHFVQADNICRAAGRFFTDAEHTAFKRHIEAALLLNHLLASRAVDIQGTSERLGPYRGPSPGRAGNCSPWGCVCLT